MGLKTKKNLAESSQKKVIASKSKEVKKIQNAKVTHLYFHDKYWTNIKCLESDKTLTTLYLHNNLITSIENLDKAINLKSLYLQKNKIKKIEGLDTLINLKKLYLSHNEINVIENLEKLVNLEELYVEKQSLDNGDSLCFDPRTIQALSSQLQILNAASNNIFSIGILRPLQYLKYFNASNNNIMDINDVCSCVENWYYLKEAHFTGNPISKAHRYREDIIGSSVRLEVLDNKDVKETTRCFIKRFEHERALRGSKTSTNVINELALLNLPKNYPPSVQKAAYNYIVHPSKEDAILPGDNVEDNAYVAWNLMPKKKTRVPLIIKNQKKSGRKKVKFNSTNMLFPNLFK